MIKDFTSDFYYGIVTDNDDPDNMGRVKVKVEILNNEFETDWIPVLSFFSGDNYGAYFVPDTDDQVIIGFMDNGYEEPFVLGGIWSGRQKPPVSARVNDKNKKNNLKIIRSKSGNMILFDDTEGNEKLKIMSGDNVKFEIIKKDDLLAVETDKDIIMDAKGSFKIHASDIEIVCENDVKLDSGNIMINANSGDINFNSNNISAEAENIKLN